MKVKEKADSFAANYGCMLTPGMRECKPDICHTARFCLNPKPSTDYTDYLRNLWMVFN